MAPDTIWLKELTCSTVHYQMNYDACGSNPRQTAQQQLTMDLFDNRIT